MRLALALALAAWLAGTSHAQETGFLWREALPIRQPTQTQLLDIARAGERLIAVGAHGLIIYSDNDTRHWQQSISPVSLTLTAVTFVDEQHGWAVGHGGVILHSDDGGQNWQLQFDGKQVNAQWLAFLQARKADLETQLKSLSDSVDNQQRRDELQSLLELTGFAIEDVTAAQASGPTDPFLDVWFTDARTGFAVGAYGMIFRTDNGGRDWQIAADAIDNPERYHYYAIERDSAGRLYLCGEAGLLYRSTDGGKQWQRIEGVYNGSLFGLVSSDDAVFAFGLRGFVFRSRDGGDTWQSLTGGEEATLHGGRQLKNGDIVLVGSGGAIAISRDNGESFQYRQHPSRGTLSTVIGDGGGMYVVGMPGLKPVSPGG